MIKAVMSVFNKLENRINNAITVININIVTIIFVDVPQLGDADDSFFAIAYPDKLL